MGIVLVVKLLEVDTNMFNMVEIWRVGRPLLHYFHLILSKPIHCKPSSMNSSIILHEYQINPTFPQFFQKIQ